MSCGNGCGCCPKCGCRATCTCNQSMYFDESMEEASFSISTVVGESIHCGPYCGSSAATGVYLPGFYSTNSAAGYSG